MFLCPDRAESPGNEGDLSAADRVGESAVFRSTMRFSELSNSTYDSFAMQKVVGSSPIIRFPNPMQTGWFCRLIRKRRKRRGKNRRAVRGLECFRIADFGISSL
jgi:hypothetical protein